MKKLCTKSIALLLAVLMLMTAVPLGVFATADSADENPALADPATCDHDYNSVPRKEATKDAHGNIKYYKCPKCGTCFASAAGAKITEASTVLHYFDTWTPQEDETEHLASKATCQANAKYYKKCTQCDTYSTDTFEVPNTKTDHQYPDEWTVPEGADCTKASFVREKRCIYCKAAPITETIPKGDHKTEKRNPVEPTCSKVGYTWGQWCVNCQKYTRGGTERPMTDHNIAKDPGYPATCTKDGLTDGQHCMTCDTQTVEQKTIPKINHVGYFRESQKKERTSCEEWGFTEDCSYCTNCKTLFYPSNKNYSAVVLEPTDHKWGEKVKEVEATDKTTGVKAHWKCAECGALSVRRIDAKGEWALDDNGKYIYDKVTEADLVIPKTNPNHTHNWKVIETSESKAATCTEDGLEVKLCTICDDITKTTLPKLEHDLKWVTLREATCTTKGARREECTRCDYKGPEYQINEKQHEWKLTAPVDCTKGGTAVYVCGNCELKDEKTVEKRAKHTDTDDDGVCEECSIQFCTCICHNKEWYGQFIYFILRVWWQFLGVHEKCDCGKVHYEKASSINIPSING